MSQEVTEVPSDKGGRPTKYTPAVIGKLEIAFNNGYNIVEACQYASIHPDTYYDWLKTYPEFSDKMEIAKAMPNRKAKEILAQAINAGDTGSAKYWLDRRDPDFKQKGELDVNHGLQETQEKLRKFFDDKSDVDGVDEISAEPITETTGQADSETPPITPDIS